MEVNTQLRNLAFASGFIPTNNAATTGSTTTHERDQNFPPQHQGHQFGRQAELRPQPQTESKLPGSNRLRDRVILVTDGDSGIGCAIPVLAAKQGADVAIAYLEEDEDAEETRRLVENKVRKCELLVGDIGKRRPRSGSKNCRAVRQD